MKKTLILRTFWCILAFASLVLISGLIWNFQTTTTHSAGLITGQENALKNYDIRIDSDKQARQIIAKLSEASGEPGSNVVDPKAKSSLNIENDSSNSFPEVISAGSGRNFLTGPNDQNRVAILRGFIAENHEVFGEDPRRINQLKTSADYTNPDGNLSFVHLSQEIFGIPVFQGEVKAGFTKRNELIRVINNLAPDIAPESVSTDFGSPHQAVIKSAAHLGLQAAKNDTITIDTESDDLKRTFERGQFSDKTTAEKIYFPLAKGVLRPAWRVLLWVGHEGFYVIADAETGILLWRKNITSFQTETAAYNVYDDDSPTPATPGAPSPVISFEPGLIPRTTLTFAGNEPPYNFNNLGWIPDGTNITSGNNAIAGIDRDGINGIDPDGTATGNPYRFFVYTYNPAPGNPPPGEEPVPVAIRNLMPPSQFQQGSTTNAFYWINRFHDLTYLAGFTEAAGNFQNDNFGRGGVGGDRVLVEVQDSAGTNNANFATPADGGSPRGQFFIFLDPDPVLPDRDIALDSQLILHEFTHGLTSRLHGNSTGIGGNLARGMNEGWSDFYAQSLLSKPTDPLDGLYPFGSYAAFTSNVAPNLNRYRGLRRFPAALKSSVGANGRPHNPLTFADIDQTQVNYSDGAFPAPTAGHLSTVADNLSNVGELWTVALWEVRGRLISTHGPVEGNRRALQYVTDGMKLSPLNPTPLQARDAIIAAALASDPADVRSVRQGFAVRGMGFSAQIINAGSGNGSARVTEAFDTANVLVADPFTVTDPNGNGNGFPEPGEPVSLSVALTNPTGQAISNVSVSISGGPPVSFGQIANGGTVTRNINYLVPVNTVCGSVHTVTISIDSDAGQRSETRGFRVGIPVGGGPVSFSNTTPINVPFAGSSSGSGPADPYPTAINVSGLTGNKTIRVELVNINHTWVSDIDILLVGPGGQKFVLMSDVFSAQNSPNTVISTLAIRDGAENLMALNGRPPVSGDFKPTNYGTPDDFDLPAPVGPYQNPATAGTATLTSVFGTNSSAMNGEWRLWIDDDAGGDIGIIQGGWKITFLTDDYVCGDRFPGARADFDGDGRTDISVFRPTEGNWYLNQSSTGFSVINWGLATDRLVPGDYDGDGRADIAVFRPVTDSNLPDFYILNSNGFTFSGYSWGLPGDIPAINDYDGDGRDDISVFRPAQDVFYVLRSATGSVLVSRPTPQDKPVALDFDGDGKGDFATYENGQWLISKSADNHQSGEVVQWGLADDLLVPADYDGDGRDDLAVFRPNEGVWYIRFSAGGTSIFQFGLNGDIPVPGDYDGDGRDDAAVYRNGIWYINGSSSGIAIAQFGLAGDMPIPNRYLP